MSLKWVDFTLNDEPRRILVNPERKLLDVIRKDFQLTGTKKGCNEGVCGTCTVLIDGRPLNSCVHPVGKVQGKAVITIEGVGTLDNLHPIQEAFINVGAAQCGFCTPGMILNAKAILDRNLYPTREEVRQAISRNLCRCTGYQKIIDGILLAAEFIRNPEEILESKQKIEKQLSLGNLIPQLNSAKKVVGALEYAIDVNVEGISHARVLRSPHAHARILSIDTTEAEALDGVIAVCTAKDLKGINKIKYIDQDMRVLADDRVRYEGEPVAIVVALNEEIAGAALLKINVQYEKLPGYHTPFEAMADGAVDIQPEDYPGNIVYSQKLVKGDAEGALKTADVIVESDYYTPSNAHAYLEPDTAIGWIDDQGRISIYTPGQAPHYHQEEVARVLGMEMDDIRIVETNNGAGFGARIDPFIQVLSGLAVYKVRRPVRLEFSMEENFTGYCKRHPFYIKMKTGATKAGKVIAHKAEIVTDAGAYSLASPGVLMRATVHSYGPYEIPNIRVEAKSVLTNNTPSSAMRGFGVPQMAFATEMQMNKIASRLGMNVLELEKLNGFREGTITGTGQEITEPTGYKEVIEAIQNHWAKCDHKYTDPEKTKKLPPHIKRGVGFATTWYGIGKTGLLNLSRAVTEVLPDGTIRVREGAADIGQGVSTVMALIAAEEMKVPLEKVEVISADTLETPDSDITCASKHTFYTGNATLGALRSMKTAAFKAAAKELGVSEKELDCSGGWVFAAGDSKKRIALAELVKKGYVIRGENEFKIPLDLLDRETGQGVLYVVFTYGATAVEVEVNTQTGEVSTLSAATCFQCGKAINRLGIEGQLEGGVGMGIGFALQEEYITGKTRGFKDYKIPKANEVPDIDTYIVEIPQKLGPYGAIGMGECSHIPMAPAIISAIHDACGIWINELPATPPKILKELQKKQLS